MAPLNPASLVCVACLLAPASAIRVLADDLASRIEQAAVGDVLEIAAGTLTSPLTVQRPLTLRGAAAQSCIVDVTSNQPAMSITTPGPVVIEGLTFRWQRATSDASEQPACAVFIKDSQVTLRNCRFIAPESNQRSPAAVLCTGFSSVKLQDCRFEGFEFTIGVEGGARAAIADCIVSKPGHCGINVYSGSQVEVARTIVTGSEFHGIRSTGGTLDVHDCVIIENANRGIYLGNRSAHGRIHNNVILGNGSGISGFAQSDVVIEHNVFADNSYSGLDARDTCPLKVHRNIFTGNTRGFVLFIEGDRNDVQLGPNCFWKNETTTESIETPADSVLTDPEFTQPDEGDFTSPLGDAASGGFGLTDPSAIRQLWTIWAGAADDVEQAKQVD